MPVIGQAGHGTGVYTSAYAGQRSEYLYRFAKRTIDIAVSLTGLIILLPLFVIVAAAIKLDSRGPSFFIHDRVGKNGGVLRLFKFRSMIPDAEKRLYDFTPEQKTRFEENYKLEDDPRVTKLGRLLRRTSLDELPQLLNILLGSLSLVGPRPVIRDELEKYGTYKQRFTSVKPGLTGHWQINGKSGDTYAERMALELYYIENASLIMDLKIMLKTAPAVIKKAGAK